MPEQPIDLPVITKEEWERLSSTISQLIFGYSAKELSAANFRIGQTVTVNFDGEEFKVSEYRLQEMLLKLTALTPATYDGIRNILNLYSPLGDSNEAALLLAKAARTDVIVNDNGHVHVYFLGRYFEFTKEKYSNYIEKYRHPIGTSQEVLILKALEDFLAYRIKPGEQ